MENKKVFSVLFLFLFCFIFVTACGKNENLLDTELLTIEENNMISSTLQKGSLIRKIKTEASVFYPITSSLCSNSSGVILNEVKVKNLDYVHKGDLLVEVRAYTPEEIAEKENYITTKENDLNSKMAYYDSEKNKLTSLLSSVANPIEKKIYEEKILQNDINKNYTYTSTAKELEKLRSELETIKAVSGDCNIYAPYDGFIESVKVNNKGTVLTDSTVVIEMYSVDTVIVYFDDPGDVYFNNKVTVNAGSGENRQTIEGTVVGADHYLHSTLKQGKIYVRLDGEYDKENLDDINVEIEAVLADNVLVTKSSGINKIKDDYFVYIMEDGLLKKRHVTVGGSDGENTWILQGADEGDIIYLQ